MSYLVKFRNELNPQGVPHISVSMLHVFRDQNEKLSA